MPVSTRKEKKERNKQTNKNSKNKANKTTTLKQTTTNQEFRSCVKVEVAVLGSLSLISLRFLWRWSNTSTTTTTTTTTKKTEQKAERDKLVPQNNDEPCYKSPRGGQGRQLSVQTPLKLQGAALEDELFVLYPSSSSQSSGVVQTGGPFSCRWWWWVDA